MEKNFEREVLDRLIKIEAKLDDYSILKEKIEIAYSKSLSNEKEIQKLQEKSAWMWRTIVGAIITTIIASITIIIK